MKNNIFVLWIVVLTRVASKSEDEPLKQSNFSKEQTGLANAKSYVAWEFAYKPKSKTPTVAVKTPAK